MSRRVVHSIPDAWPLLMTFEQAIAYVGGMDDRTFLKICPVQALDIGAQILRYHRLHLDAWADTLKPRLPKGVAVNNNGPVEIAPESEASIDTAARAVERARNRAMDGGKKCRKTSR